MVECADIEIWNICNVFAKQNVLFDEHTQLKTWLQINLIFNIDILAAMKVYVE